MIQMTRFSD